MTGCRKQQPKQQTEESPTADESADTSSSTMSDSFPSTNHDPTYAHIGQIQEPVSGNGDLHNKISSANDTQAHGAVMHSELQSKDNDGHVVAPSGDLYAQVQKP